MEFTVADWPVKPMEPKTCADAFDDADTLFQVKWDGVRVLTYVYPDGGVRLFNRRLNERTQQYPEICDAFFGFKGGTALDGEVVALGMNGMPDFPRVLQRDFIRSPVKAKMLVKSIPVQYMVFDVLWLNGAAVHALPLKKRLELLHGLPMPAPFMHKVENVSEKGIALFEAVKAEGLEGIVAKRAESPYKIGKKTDAWKKIKCFRNITGIVGGYLQEGPSHIRSLLIGIEEPEGLRYIGTAASGITQREWQALKNLFAMIPGPCPFLNPPAAQGLYWVKPEVKIGVRFLEYTAEGVMRAPSVTALPKGLI